MITVTCMKFARAKKAELKKEEKAHPSPIRDTPYYPRLRVCLCCCVSAIDRCADRHRPFPPLSPRQDDLFLLLSSPLLSLSLSLSLPSSLSYAQKTVSLFTGRSKYGALCVGKAAYYMILFM